MNSLNDTKTSNSCVSTSQGSVSHSLLSPHIDRHILKSLTFLPYLVTGLNELNSARSFVEQQVEAIRDYVGENPSSSWDQTIKPIRSINLHGVAEDDQGIDMVFWLNLPGQIGIADVWGSNKVLRVTTFA